MNFEERMDRLTDRHEAFAQSVELLLIATRENTENMARFAAETSRNIDKLVEVTNRDAADIAVLARIAESRERRINGLEEGRV
jgi:hypothetical protein